MAFLLTILIPVGRPSVVYIAFVRAFEAAVAVSGLAMSLPFASLKAEPLRGAISPQQLFDAAAADKDYSDEACLRSLASRTVMLTDGGIAGHDQGPGLSSPAATPGTKRIHGPCRRLARLARSLKPLLRTGKTNKGISQPLVKESSTSAFAVASVTYAEPGLWQGRKAHFLRLHFEYHSDAAHHLEAVYVTVRVWKAGDALQSFAPLSHLHLFSVQPPYAPEFGDEAPSIVLYAPRAVVGRDAGSKAEPFWDGHFKTGDHFEFMTEAMPPVNVAPPASKQPSSLLNIKSSGDPNVRCTAPSFDVGMVVLSDGKPFDMTAYSTSLHWGLPAVQRHLFGPYHPAKFSPSTRLIPKGESPIASDFAEDGMKDKLMEKMKWGKPYDTMSILSLHTRHTLTVRSGWEAPVAVRRGLRDLVEGVGGIIARHVDRA